MVPFAANIINTVVNSQELSVYAIAISKGEMDYRKYITHLEPGRIKFINYHRNLIGNIIDKFYNYRLLRSIEIFVKEYKIQYIHFLTGDYTLNQIIPKLRKIAKIVYTVHDLNAHETTHRKLKAILFEKYMLWGVKKNTYNADILVTCSKNQFRHLKEQYYKKPVFFHQFPSLVTQMMLDANSVCPELKNVQKYILFFGTIHKYKGIELLYDVFCSNSIFHSNYSLVMAGSGDWYFDRKENEKNVIRINRYIVDTEVKTLFENAACVIYPYISATMSGVLTLAYKFGVPLIVSDIPYFLDNVENGKTAFVFKNRDKTDLTNKMEQLLFNTDMEEMQYNQKEFYKRHYSANAMLKELETIYQI
jgi:glycosyltransferase involved in cell wall biosynthesis